MLVEKSTWKIECPCKNNCLKKGKKINFSVGTFKSKKEDLGNFFYSEKGGIFENLYFKENENYSGPFLFKSPLKVFIDITEVCNLNCRECYLANKKKKEQSIGKLKKLINALSKEEVMGVQLLGGEPTLYSKLPELCRYIKSKKMKVEIVSNGFNLQESLINELKGNIDSFCVSIDGDEGTHNYLRRNENSYSNAKESVKKVLRAGFQTEIVMSINKMNYKEISKVKKILGGKGKLSIKLMIPFSGESKKLLLKKKDIENIKNTCKKEKIQMNSFSVGFNECGKSSFFGCPGGKIDAVIDVDGNVFKCNYHRSKRNSMGNVYKESFKKIWKRNNDYILKNELTKCKCCDFRNRCGGFCDIKLGGR